MHKTHQLETQNSKLKSIKSILIANRGEIASRIIRTCKKMGIQSIAVYADADRLAPYVSEASVAVHIGSSNASQSYLDADKILAVAKKMSADAIHPGYGFLSENAAFAERCEKEGIIFIGPNSHAIASMGSKSRAKEIMEAQGVPTIPGYKGSDQSADRLKEEADKIGYPILLKATAGGGGKGMRIVTESAHIEKSIAAAQRESKSAFGNDELIVEKYIENGRHIEFQIFGDKHGNTIHILERECSIQRRYQKIMEESPSPIMSAALRERMGEAAILAAEAIKYDNAGTVEFIYDEASDDFYFLEVNTRLQVEHPVTEEITGLDLVKLQIEVAMGKPLSIQQNEIKGDGYALELRLYAEDPSNNFLPVTGTIQDFIIPEVEGLRVETAIKSGSKISMYYDPMIAKLIVKDSSREDVMRKMQYVLDNLVCTGTTTNQSFLRKLVAHQNIVEGIYDTHFIDEHLSELTILQQDKQAIHKLAIATALYQWHSRQQARTILRAMPSGWRNSFYQMQSENYLLGGEEVKLEYRKDLDLFHIKIDNEEYQASIIEIENQNIICEIDGYQYPFHISNVEKIYNAQNSILGNVELLLKDRFPKKEVAQEKGGYKSPMPSQIIKILVAPGDKISEGDGLVILSSMKMESTLNAYENGIVEEIYISEGQNIEADYLLLKIKPNNES